MSAEIITREASWSQLTDKEREGLAEGFHTHLKTQSIIPPEMTTREVYQLCEDAEIHITFFRRYGKDQFRLSVDKNKAFQITLNQMIDKILQGE
jgi:hypothetical protein